MKKVNYLALGGLAASLMLFSGCQDEEFGYTKEEINTQASFEKHFGKIAPDQIWDFSSYNLNRLGLAGGFASVGATRAASDEANTPKIDAAYAETYPTYYEVPKSLTDWIDKNLREEVYNKKRGTTNFTLQMPDTKDIVIIPIYQGQAGLNYNLCIKSEGGTTDPYDGYIWQKSGGIQVKDYYDKDGNWISNYTNITGQGFDDHSVGRTTQAQPVRIKHDKVKGNFSLYLDILNLKSPWDGQGGSSFEQTFNDKKHASSTDGQMVAITLDENSQAFNDVSEALKKAFTQPTDGQYTFKNFMLIGVEDSNLKRNIAGPDDARLVGTDWDMNDVIFLIVGITKESIVYKKTEVISKRYMVEDLGIGYGKYLDYDFNDIVIDVTQTKEYDKAGNTLSCKQILSLKHLCGTIPWRVQVGDYVSPIFPGCNDHTNKKGYDPAVGTEDMPASIYKEWIGKNKDQDVSGIIDIEITGWDPDNNNIIMTVWPAAAGLEPTKTQMETLSGYDWSDENKEKYLKEVDGTSYAFPADGEYPFIIACDQTQNWTIEHETIPEAAIQTWKKPEANITETTTPGGGSGEGGDSGDDDGNIDGYNSFVIALPEPDSEGIITAEVDVTFDSWTDDILINPEYLQSIKPGWTITTKLEPINDEQEYLMYMKVEAPWENIGDNFKIDKNTNEISIQVTTQNYYLLKEYGIALKGMNVHVTEIKIEPGEYDDPHQHLPWSDEDGYSVDWGNNKLYFDAPQFADVQPGDQIVIECENSGEPIQLKIQSTERSLGKEIRNQTTYRYDITAGDALDLMRRGMYIQGNSVKIYSVSVVTPEYYTLTVGSPSNGTVIVTPKSENDRYAEGTTVNLMAVPANGYHFVKWANGSTSMELSLTINDDTTVDAPVFAEGENEYLWSGSRTVTNWKDQNLTLAIAGKNVKVGDYLVFETDGKWNLQVVFGGDWDKKKDEFERNNGTYKLKIDQFILDKLSDSNVIAINSDNITISAVKYEEGIPPVVVASVSLNETTHTLNVGENFTLTATVNPSNADNKSVTWSSSNESVATVNNGVVTAHAVGNATIKVTTQDGGKTATCEVTVNPAPQVDVESVSLNYTDRTLSVGKSFTLTATVNPTNATNKNVTWSSNNESVATVTNGVVKAVAEGEAKITVTTEDREFTAICTVTVNASSETPIWTGNLSLVPNLQSIGNADDIKDLVDANQIIRIYCDKAASWIEVYGGNWGKVGNQKMQNLNWDASNNCYTAVLAAEWVDIFKTEGIGVQGAGCTITMVTVE